MGKSRVVPLKPITIPRLELSAALLSVKVGLLLNQELDYQNLVNVYWTDSKVVLGYLSNEAPRFHVFVAIRVQQIKDHTDISQWRHAVTQQNPADIASRGVSAKEFMNNPLWFKGSEFLWKSEIPESSAETVGVDPHDAELKRSRCLVTETKPDSFPSLLERTQYFSDCFGARKVVAGCLRFVDLLRSRSVKRPAKVHSLEYIRSHSLPGYQPLTVAEIQRAETAIVRLVQADSFIGEIKVLRSQEVIGLLLNKGELSKRHKSLRGKSQKLDPFLDKNGILRVGGRIKTSENSDVIKFPVVLPRK